jgi:IS4 transposase
LTNIPVISFEDAYEKIQWYAARWKIETFFKILKSGCKTEQSKLRSAERLAKFITLCSVIAWKYGHMERVVKVK